MEELLNSQLYSDCNFEKIFIKNYNLFKEKFINNFTKHIINLFENSSDPGLSLSEPLYDFTIPLLAPNTILEEKVMSIRFIGILSNVSPDFVEDNLIDVIKIAEDILIDNNINGYYISSAAEFFASISNSFPNESRETIMKLLPILLKYVKREIKIDENHRSPIATAICDIVAQYDIRDLACDLSIIAYEDLLSENSTISSEGVEMIFVLCKSLLPDTSNELYHKLLKILPNYHISNSINVLIRSMKGLMKKYKINIEDCKNTIKLIFEGKVKSIGQIDLIEDPDTAVFEILKTFTKKFKKESLPYLMQVIELLPFLDSSIISTASLPIDAAIKLNLFDENIIKNLIEKLSILLLDTDNTTSTVIFLLFVAIKRNYKELLNDDDLFQKLDDKWELIDEEVEQELASAISMLTFEICSSHFNDLTTKMNYSFINEILEKLPFSSDYFDLEHILDCIFKIKNSQWIFNIRNNLCFFLIKILLMKKNEIEEFDISNEILNQSKISLKNLINKDLQNQILEKFGKTKLIKNQILNILK